MRCWVRGRGAALFQQQALARWRPRAYIWACRTVAELHRLLVIDLIPQSNIGWGFCNPVFRRSTRLEVSSMAMPSGKLVTFRRKVPEPSYPQVTAELVIALHSPDKVTETGLRMCLPEKCR